MNIDYKILWFEDTDESFDTLSKRTTNYVESKNLRCKIERFWTANNFDINNINLNTYEILVVDLRLADGTSGKNVIQQIRSGNYVNDVLFYSSEGTKALNDIMKAQKLEGVFITERNNNVFMDKIKLLIEKSVRRSENIINIRGIVLDETSGFDMQMCEITRKVEQLVSLTELKQLKAYVIKLLSEENDKVNKFLEQYKVENEWTLSEIVMENDFNSMMKAKLLNKILKIKTNSKIIDVVNGSKKLLPQAFEGTEIQFVKAYNHDIIFFRNKLAHTKTLNEGMNHVFIGKLNGKEYHCDAEFCSMLRASLIKYNGWFKEINNNISNA